MYFGYPIDNSYIKFTIVIIILRFLQMLALTLVFNPSFLKGEELFLDIYFYIL